MKKQLIRLILAAAMLLPTAVAAQDTLTVADGTATSSYVPFYTCMADFSTRTQSIYPSDWLVDMTSGAITSMTFYLSSPATSAVDGTWSVKLANVDYDAFASTMWETALEEVYSGSLDLTQNTVTIVFAAPFVYEGGGLLLDVSDSGASSYNCSLYALGTTCSNASISTYGTDAPTLRHFVGKTTFVYTVDGTVCLRPTNLAASEVTESSFTVSWDDVDGASGYIVYLNGEEYTTTSGTSVSLSGLGAGTSYTVGVATDCGDAQSSTRNISVRTECAADMLIAAPWSESFADSIAIDCWTLVDADADGHSWSVGDGSANARYNDDGADNWAILPPMQIEDGQSTVFEWDEYGTYYSYNYTYYEVRLSTADGTDTADFATVLYSHQFAYYDYDQWIHHQVNLSQYAGQTVRIAFRHLAAGDDGMSIDNLALRLADAPMVSISGATVADMNQPTAFAAVLVEGSTDGLGYTWTSARAEAGEATTTEVDDSLFVTYTDGQYDTITLVATNSYGSDTATMVVFIRNCQAVATFPWTESFEVAEAIECWTLYNFTTSTNPAWTRSSTYASAGTYSMRSSYNTSVAANAWLITPPISVPDEADGLSFFFDHRIAAYSSNPATLDVRISPTAGTDTASFTVLATSVSNASTSVSGFTTLGVGLDQYAGQTIRVAIVHSSYNDNGAYVDNVQVRSTDMPVVSIGGSNMVDLGETAHLHAVLNEGSQDGLGFTWHSAMADAGNATMDADWDSASITYAAIGIDTVSVVAANSFGNDTAVYYVRVRDLAPADLPYSTGFEADAADNANWQLLGTNQNLWVIDTAAANSGQQGLYISNDNGVTNGSTNNSNGTASFAIRYLNFAEAGEHTVSYDWRAAGTSYSDYLRVLLAPASIEFVGGQTGGVSGSSVPTDCIALDGGSQLYNGATWQHVERVVDIPAAGIYQLVFYWRDYGTCNPAAAIDNVSVAPLSCSSPVALTADTVGETVIGFHWTPRGDESSWQVSIDQTTVVVTDTFYTATGLVSSTAYAVSVRAICAEGDTSLALAGTLRTVCGTVNVPWTESFEDVEVLSCWTTHNYTASTNPAWTRSTAYASDGSASVRSSFSSSEAANAWLVSPAIEVPADADGITFFFDYRASAYSGNEPRTRVLVSTTAGTDTAAFTDTVLDIDGNTNNQFVRHSFTLDAYAGQTIRVAFHHCSYNDNGVYVDNVQVRNTDMPIVTVSGPTSAFAGTAATFTATLVEGSQNGLAYSWSSTMQAAGTATMTANGDTMSITYTAAGTDVVTVSATNAFGTATATINVAILDCGTVSTFPFNEGFESDDLCWTTFDADGDGHNWRLATSTGTDLNTMTMHGGSDCYVSASWDNNASGNYELSPDNWLVSQPIALPANAATLSWWYECTYNEDPSEHFAVYIGTSNAISALEATTPVFEETLGSDNYNNWQQASIDLSPYLGQTVYVAFRHYDCTGNFYLAIDDVSIVNEQGGEPIPGPETCAAPTNLHQSGATTTTVTIDWTPGGSESQWQLEADGGQPATVSSHPYVVSGLQPGSSHTFRVRAVCGQGNYSDWSASISVSTDTTDTPGPDGIEDAAVAAFGLYPNPASTTVRVEVNGEARIAIIDQSGRTVASVNANGSTDIDVSQLAKGAYYVRVSTADATAIRKLIVR